MTPAARCLCALLSLAAATGVAAAPPEDATARDLHYGAIVVDTHVDVTQRMLDPAFDLGVRHADGHFDLPRGREGGLDALFFSIYLPGTVTGAEAFDGAMQQIDAVHRAADRSGGQLVLATTAADVRRAAADGHLAALIGIEGGHMIANDLGNLRRLHASGARYMTLTHGVNVDWADSSTDEPRHGGLDDFGRRVVREMNRLGMIVDVSHVSDGTIEDVLETSAAPVFASHSSSQALCNVPRNLSDRMIRAIAAKGGVVQVNYYVGFLSQSMADTLAADDGHLRKEIESAVEARCGTSSACTTIAEEAMYRDYMASGRLPRVEWTDILRHIDHVARLVGVDHVGLGSDFDGAIMPYGMDDAAALPKITEGLLERGYSVEDVRKILGGNTLRLMEQVERVASPSE